jgi:serine-type D-Ala-D-Ala carboxypeptidase/endopeptidase
VPDVSAPRRDLERVVHEHAERTSGRYVGLVIGAIAGNERVTVGVGRTAERGDTPDERTVFQIGSVTKVLTSLLLADAVLRGEVSLDQPLATLIPETATHASGRPITLVDLATHSSGLCPGCPPASFGRLCPTVRTPTPASPPRSWSPRSRAHPGARPGRPCGTPTSAPACSARR